MVPPESPALIGAGTWYPMGEPVASGVAGVATTDPSLVPARTASALTPPSDEPLVSPPTMAPAEAWEPALPSSGDEAALVEPISEDCAEAAVWPEPEAPETVGEATAWVDAAGPVSGLPPESPETATGALVEMAVASPVFPLLEAVELALEGPESPDVAVGLDTTSEPPPVPPPELPVEALSPAVAERLAPKAGEAKNRTVVIAAAVATHETIDRRLVVSVINPILRD